MTTKDWPARLDLAPVAQERDQDEWEDRLGLYDQPDVVDMWRTAGFTLSEASRWTRAARDIVAGDEAVADDDEATKVALVSALIVASLSPDEAVQWAGIVPWRRCGDLAKQVVEWRAAGFTPDGARTWAEEESIESAVLLANAGWTPAERDLLNAWVEVQRGHLDLAYRTRMLHTAAAPNHVLDYVRAGIDPTEVTYYERLRREGRDITEDLRQRAAGGPVPDESTTGKIDTLLDQLGPRTGLHAERLGTEMPPITHEPLSPLPPTFEAPAWSGDSLTHGLDTYERGYGDWDGHWPPEDSACPPRMEWKQVHHDAVLAAFTEQWGDALAANEEFALDWPPNASLWTGGHAYEEVVEYCSEHDDDYDEECDECAILENREEEIEPAVWHWYVTVTTYENRDGDLVDRNTQHVHIMTSEMDPRIVEYTESGYHPDRV